MSLTEDDFLYDESENALTQTVIQNRYCFYCLPPISGADRNNYEACIKLISSFQTIEHFWRIYNHLIRPNDLKQRVEYHLFKSGIKPTWEDPQNKQGGKWSVQLKKGLASRYWEELVLAIIGEQFDVGHEICGAVVSVRTGWDVISIWNKNSENTEAKNKIRDQLRRILRLPAFINIEYKKHMDFLEYTKQKDGPLSVEKLVTSGATPIPAGPPSAGSNAPYKNPAWRSKTDWQQGDSPRANAASDSTDVPEGGFVRPSARANATRPTVSGERASAWKTNTGGGATGSYHSPRAYNNDHHSPRNNDHFSPRNNDHFSPRSSDHGAGSGDPVRDREREKSSEGGAGAGTYHNSGWTKPTRNAAADPTSNSTGGTFRWSQSNNKEGEEAEQGDTGYVRRRYDATAPDKKKVIPTPSSGKADVDRWTRGSMLPAKEENVEQQPN